jgi:hypothetical protein
LALNNEEKKMSYDSKADKDILDEIKKDINAWFNYFKNNIDRYKKEVRFTVLGEQWDEADKAEYDDRRKPRLTINKLYSYIQQIVGEQRSNTADIELNTDENIDKKIIEIHEGLVRDIAYNSKGEIAAQTAFECALLGYGAIAVNTEFENSNSFNQRIIIETIKDPVSVFFDPAAKDVTKEDGDFCGMWNILSHDEFKALWPNKEITTGLSLGENNIEGLFEWMTNDNVAVVDVYKKKWKRKKISLLSNGEVVDSKDADEIISAHYAQYATDQYGNYTDNFVSLEIVDERWTKDYEIWHYKISGVEILEKTKWPSKLLPLVFMDGNSYTIEGEQITKSFTEFAHDAQRYYNFLKSDITQYIKSGRKEQWYGDVECIAGYEEVWKNPDRIEGLLPFRTIPGKQSPSKTSPIEIPSSLMAQQAYVDTEIHTVLGIFQSTRGDIGNEISGVAIANKIRQGYSSAYVYIDNRNRAIEQIGRIVVSLIPHIYDTERSIFITDADNQQKSVKINDGETNISKSNFNIKVKAGSSFAMQKNENITKMKDLMQIYPDARPYLVGDYVKNLDLNNAVQLARELDDALVPEHVKAKREGRQPAPQPPNPMMIAQMQNLHADTKKKQSEAIKNQSQAIKNQTDTQIEGIATIDSLMNSHMDRTHDNAKLDMQNRKIDAEMYKAQAELIDKMITTTEKGV